MKFADLKLKHAAMLEASASVAVRQHGVSIFVPTQRSERNLYNSESISLASGICPMCGEEVTAEIDNGKVFYQCQNLYHFFVRDAME